MREILLSVTVLLLVGVLTLVLVLRRGGGEDLLATQMKRTGSPDAPVRASSDALPRHDSSRDARTPDARTPDALSRDAGTAVDPATWRRIGDLAVAGKRVQAIELLRAATGCRLTEAKAVVDQLTVRRLRG